MFSFAFDMRFGISFILIALFFSSCKFILAMRELPKETATVHTMHLGDKQVGFVPMHHLGKPAFYTDVKRIVMDYKKQGFVVYYEMVKPLPDNDSVKLDTIRRKMRKIMGTSGNYKQTMDSVGFFKSYVLQPRYSEMGIDSTDTNADVNLQQLVQEWEQRAGEVKLDSIDFKIPLSATYLRRPVYGPEKWNKVALDYRNNSLVNTLAATKDKKILLVYGAAHFKGVKKLLAQENKKTLK